MTNIKLKDIPKQPGIYQFLDNKGKIIYIGKSVNLFSRVSSYFNGKAKLSFAKKKMVDQINDIKTIVTNTESESLILETTLIKKHLPKYNILMKDDKNHTYIKITNEIIPKVIKTRIKNKSGTYFGPYISTTNVNNILKLIKKLFGYRSCMLKFEGKQEIKISNVGNQKIPCMDYYIGRCAGPCLLKNIHIKEYLDKIEDIKLFLKGDFGNTKKRLEEKMKDYAKELKFEEAEKIKNDIISINILENNQIVRDKIEGNYDIINYIEKFDSFFIGLIEIRDSKITDFNNYMIQNKLKENKENIIKTFIERRSIENKNNIIYILPESISDITNIKLEIPKIGGKLDLLKLCYKNIYEYAYKKHLASLGTKGFTKKTMQNLLSILGYKEINKTLLFECNDISHLAGTHSVASRSIIENGKSNTSKYKKFKIKTLDNLKIDDFSSMKEIMERRLKEMELSGFIPDLIIIDGGKGQLSSVVKIVNKYPNIKDKLQLVSIAKREEEVFLPGETEPILLNKESSELRLIQKIRDEAHRFAITFNRDKRIKASKKNILESLPGFGPKTRIKLLKKIGNVDKLKNIKKSELEKIINKNQIETLEDHGLL